MNNCYVPKKYDVLNFVHFESDHPLDATSLIHNEKNIP